MVKCCKECVNRMINCHSRCNTYRAYKTFYAIQKKKNTVIYSQGFFLYNKNKEYSIRRKNRMN